jgi:hypothetical protein
MRNRVPEYGTACIRTLGPFDHPIRWSSARDALSGTTSSTRPSAGAIVRSRIRGPVPASSLTLPFRFSRPARRTSARAPGLLFSCTREADAWESNPFPLDGWAPWRNCPTDVGASTWAADRRAHIPVRHHRRLRAYRRAAPRSTPVLPFCPPFRFIAIPERCSWKGSSAPCGPRWPCSR